MLIKVGLGCDFIRFIILVLEMNCLIAPRVGSSWTTENVPLSSPLFLLLALQWQIIEHALLHILQCDATVTCLMGTIFTAAKAW